MGCIVNKPKTVRESLPQITEVATVDRIDNKRIEDFLSMVRPLDLIVFRGRDEVSHLIRGLEAATTGNGEVSHCELAITMEWCSRIKPLDKFEIKPHQLLSWGSTMSGSLNDGAVNIETGAGTFGVQFRDLEGLVRHYLAKPNVNVGLCRLLDNPTCQRQGETPEAYYERSLVLKRQLCIAYDKHNGRVYNANPLALLGAMFPQVRRVRDGANEVISRFIDVNKWLFCSELVATVYIEAGIIDDKTDGIEDGRVLDPADILPVDFLGVDADKNGIRNAICEASPVWIKTRVELLRE
jgi:hypothetical protein